MIPGFRRKAPFWRASEARIARPELWAMAVVVVGMLLVQVWQSARLAQDCMKLDRRAELEPIAARIGLVPVESVQQIDLPASYLASEGAVKAASSPSKMAWLDRVSRALIPEATARSRSGS